MPQRPQVRRAPSREVRIAPAAGRAQARASDDFREKRRAASAEQTAATPPTLAAPPAAAVRHAEAVDRAYRQRRFGTARPDRRVRLASPGETRLVVHGPRSIRPWPICRRGRSVTRNSQRPPLLSASQMGTTSQAHSEVLCQRMQRIQLELRGRRAAVEGQGRTLSDDRAYDEPLPWLAPVEDEDEPRGVSARRRCSRARSSCCSRG